MLDSKYSTYIPVRTYVCTTVPVPVVLSSERRYYLRDIPYAGLKSRGDGLTRVVNREKPSRKDLVAGTDAY